MEVGRAIAEGTVPFPTSRPPAFCPPQCTPNLAPSCRLSPAAAELPWSQNADVINSLPSIAGAVKRREHVVRVRPSEELPGEERSAVFACRNVLREVTITVKCISLWEPYKCGLSLVFGVGRREAHRWGHELSAFSHSVPCPLGRSETRAKSGPNRALPEFRGGEFPENGAPREGRLGRRCHRPRPCGGAWRMPP